jgi:hypothetical protein
VHSSIPICTDAAETGVGLASSNPELAWLAVVTPTVPRPGGEDYLVSVVKSLAAQLPANGAAPVGTLTTAVIPRPAHCAHASRAHFAAQKVARAVLTRAGPISEGVCHPLGCTVSHFAFNFEPGRSAILFRTVDRSPFSF